MSKVKIDKRIKVFKGVKQPYTRVLEHSNLLLQYTLCATGDVRVNQGGQHADHENRVHARPLRGAGRRRRGVG